MRNRLDDTYHGSECIPGRPDLTTMGLEYSVIPNPQEYQHIHLVSLFFQEAHKAHNTAALNMAQTLSHLLLVQQLAVDDID